MTAGFGLDGVHVIERGAKDSPPLLFVHGWGVSCVALIECIDFLAEHHRVIAPELPGFGRSLPLSPPVSYAAYADVLDAWMRSGRFRLRPSITYGRACYSCCGR